MSRASSKARLVEVGDRVQIRVSLVSIEQHLGIALGTEVPSSDVIDCRASRERDYFIVVCEHGRRNGPWEATAKAEMLAPNLRTVRRSRSQSVETASGVFMVSPEAADNREEFSRSRWQVAKKSDPRLRFLGTAAISGIGGTARARMVLWTAPTLRHRSAISHLDGRPSLSGLSGSAWTCGFDRFGMDDPPPGGAQLPSRTSGFGQ